jgi:CheY-like chemotaxis protein
MMPMVDGFATLEQIKQDETIATLQSNFLICKKQRKDIEKVSLRRQFICSQAFLCQKN